jgi:hypothetical protein
MEMHDLYPDWFSLVSHSQKYINDCGYTLVIQGPTTYCREMTEFYKGYTCIWSTWSNEPIENLNYLRDQENVYVVVNDLPKFSDKDLSDLSEHASWTLQRATYQFTSTLKGFEYALEKFDSFFAIKIRSDFFVDVPTLIEKCNPNGFNSLGWHTGSVGYFVDYCFAGQVGLITELMKISLNLKHPSHSENVLTYSLLEKLRHRDVDYFLDRSLYTYSLKHKYDTELFLGEIDKGKWINDKNKLHVSDNVMHTFTKDKLPDNYPLTYGWGPGV